MIKAIEANQITKLFETRRAVDSISFTVTTGETFGILGPNGAGKSTKMRMIACLSPLSDGKLLVDGLDVTTEDKKIRSLIGVVPQENHLAPDLNVLENLLVYSTYFRIPNHEARNRADELLRFIKLEK
jgi:lipooligosaccharide transport system ATP-binding protein